MSSVITIDCDYVAPRVACAFLIVDNGRAVFVENNTTHAVPKLLQALASNGLKPEDVDYAIITHIHLDHAGGSGALVRACPNAKLLSHPRSARHAIDPSRIEASARHVYGEDFDRLYGEIVPVPEERVRIMEDGEVLEWQSRKFRFIYTKGHSNHHFCIYDSGSNGIFCGDAFGIAYPDLAQKGTFIFPSTTPTDFDADEAILALHKIVGTGADRAYLTHFGTVTNLEALRQELEEGLLVFRKLAVDAEDPAIPDSEVQSFCEAGVRSYFQSLITKKGLSFGEREWTFLNFDLVLNAQGIAFRANRNREKKKAPIV